MSATEIFFFLCALTQAILSSLTSVLLNIETSFTACTAKPDNQATLSTYTECLMEPWYLTITYSKHSKYKYSLIQRKTLLMASS